MLKGLVTVLLCLGLILISSFAGQSWISVSSAFDASSQDHGIFWSIRVPRTVLAMFAGAALAISGMVFQGIFRNALATPYTLGVASGVSLGAIIGIKYFSFASIYFISSTIFGALIGAVVSMLLLMLITRYVSAYESVTLLLAGVALNFLFSSSIMFAQYTSDFVESFRAVRWIMGGVDIVGYDFLYCLLPLFLIGLLMVVFFLPELDQISLGEEEAMSRGVDLLKSRNYLIIGASTLVASVVSVTGPIGFIGIIIPHICRILFGPGHKKLAFYSLIVGASFLVFSDMMSRIFLAPNELPVGVITSIVGAPFFIWVLFRTNR